jgi:hypothetical protein
MVSHETQLEPLEMSIVMTDIMNEKKAYDL